MTLTLTSVLGLLALTLVALIWLEAVVAVRRTHRARQWRGEHELVPLLRAILADR